MGIFHNLPVLTQHYLQYMYYPAQTILNAQPDSESGENAANLRFFRQPALRNASATTGAGLPRPSRGESHFPPHAPAEVT